MKAIKFMSVVLAALALAFTSCSKDDDPSFSTSEPKVVEAADHSKITGTVSFEKVGSLEIVSQFNQQGLCTSYVQKFVLANAQLAEDLYNDFRDEVATGEVTVRRDGTTIIVDYVTMKGIQYELAKATLSDSLQFYYDAYHKGANNNGDAASGKK